MSCIAPSPVASSPTNLMAVQEGLTSIRVSWSPPTPLGDTTGYRIDYSDSDSSDCVNVSGGSTDNYLLTGLQNGDSYTISIIATSQHHPSDAVDDQVTLSETLITEYGSTVLSHLAYENSTFLVINFTSRWRSMKNS